MYSYKIIYIKKAAEISRFSGIYTVYIYSGNSPQEVTIRLTWSGV